MRKPLLTPGKTSALLGVPMKTLEAWRRKGVGPRYLVLPSRQIRYDPDDLEQWIAARSRRSPRDQSDVPA